jgi:hypothetical protein
VSEFGVNDDTAQRMINLVLSTVQPQETVNQSKEEEEEEEEVQQQRHVRDAANFVTWIARRVGAVKHMPIADIIVKVEMGPLTEQKERDIHTDHSPLNTITLQRLEQVTVVITL